MTTPGPQPGDAVETLTTCATHQEAAMIRYALGIRQISSTIRERRGITAVRKGGRTIDVLVPAASLARAREALPYISNAMFGESLAIDADGACALCGYDMRGVTHTTVCPECGEDLASINAKRRAGKRI